MNQEISPIALRRELLNEKEFLIVQDLDGVCIPLVKDPLKRKINISYVEAARKLEGEFAVLTNGEHEGKRGVNRLIEKAYEDNNLINAKDKYLPGLAAGGIEYQNHFGEVEYPGVSEKELDFLRRLPKRMEELLYFKLKEIFPQMKHIQAEKLAIKSVLDTNFSPTINLNSVFSVIPNNVAQQKKVQKAIQTIMDNLINMACSESLSKSFFLHIAPNLGKVNEREIIKFSSVGDIGTTDIQFMLSGALKESGLLVLINKFIQAKYGKAPFGEDFNVRNAPKSISKLKNLCYEKIPQNQMPLLIGIGDTVTSNKSEIEQKWLRGGSDRGFLTLIQELGTLYKKENKVVLVDSSGGEVERPRISNDLAGISDPEDPLKFNTYFREGPESYIEWFNELAESRMMQN